MARTLRVAVIIDSLGRGGAEWLLTDLATGARRAGIDVVVGHLEDRDGNPGADRLRSADIAVTNLGVERLLRPSSVPRVRRWIASVAPDVVHTHLGYSDMLGGLAARSLGVPSVSTLHVLQWHHGRFRDDLKESLFGLARRTCAGRVVAVSAAAREVYLDTGRDRSDHVVVVHNGVVDRHDPGSGAAVRAELGIPPDARVISIVAVLRPGKGHDLALDVIDDVRRRHPGAVLLVAGDGPEARRLSDRAAASHGAVIMAGHRDDVPAVLDATDVVLHPTELDAFPTSLLEAAAAGVPVVATAVGGVPEIVEHDVTGLLVPLGAGAHEIGRVVGELLDDPARRLGLGRNARTAYEERFSAFRWGERLRSLYEDVRA